MNAESRRPRRATGSQKSAGVDTTSVGRQNDVLELNAEQSRLLHNWIGSANSIPADRLAFVAVVELAEGKYRRRPYLTLAAAQRAVERAEARGVAASVLLCELVPLRGDR